MLLKNLKIYCLLFTILTSTKIYSQNFDTVVIRYHKWGVEPTHIVPCIKFEREYGIKKEYKITEKALTDSLKKLLGSLKKGKEKRLSVECKIYFINNGEVKREVCLNSKYVMDNGKIRKNNPLLISFINRLMITHSSSECDKRFYPSYIGNEFEGGVDSLYSYLNNEINKNNKLSNVEKTRFLIRCNVSKKGKSNNIDLRFIKCPSPNNSQLELYKHLYNIIRKIKWKSNPNRTKLDISEFYFIYPMNRNYCHPLNLRTQ